MNTDDVVKLINAIAGLLAAIAWPFLCIFVMLRFRSAIERFFESLGEFSLKGGGIEASAKKKRIHAAASLAAAAATDSRDKQTPQQAAQAASEVVSDVLTNRAVKRASKTKILWVDDRPDNNISERESLQDLGITIRLATSTEQAMDRLTRERFDLVISDMGRPPDERAGYTLLLQMQSSGIKLPVIFYAAGGNLPEHKRQANAKGAFASTNRATELFQSVFRALDAV